MTSIEIFGLLQREAARLRWKKRPEKRYEQLGVIRIEMMVDRKDCIRWPNGVVYRMKRSGPRTDPGGTHRRVGGVEMSGCKLLQRRIQWTDRIGTRVEQCQRRRTKWKVAGGGCYDLQCRMQISYPNVVSKFLTYIFVYYTS